MTMQLDDMGDLSGHSEAIADRDGHPALRGDESSFKIENAIVSTDHNYRLLTIVSTDNYQRIVDPAFAILCLARSQAICCTHTSASLPVVPIDGNIRFQTLNSVFGTWDLVPGALADPPSSDPHETIPTAYILDDHTKFNSILCLCQGGCTLIDVHGCLDCAAKEARKLDISKSRRILRRPKISQLARALTRR
jgi:hypothetical protein